VGFVQCGHFANNGKRGSSDADVLTFGRKKTSDLLKFMVCPHGQGRRGGWDSANILRTRGRVNFSWFCADALYGQPL